MLSIPSGTGRRYATVLAWHIHLPLLSLAADLAFLCKNATSLTMQIEKDSAYIKAMESAGKAVERIIKINNAIDIYEEFFKYE